MLDSLDESLCPPSPSGRVEAVSTNQADIVQVDQPRMQGKMGGGARLGFGLVDSGEYPGRGPHPIESWLSRLTRPRSCEPPSLECKSTAKLVRLPPPVKAMGQA